MKHTKELLRSGISNEFHAGRKLSQVCIFFVKIETETNNNKHNARPYAVSSSCCVSINIPAFVVRNSKLII